MIFVPSSTLVPDQQLTFDSYLQLQYLMVRMHPRTKGTYRACHRVRRSRVVARQRTPVKLMAVIQAGQATVAPRRCGGIAGRALMLLVIASEPRHRRS